MSYILDALKKAEQEKDTQFEEFNDNISSSPRKIHILKKKRFWLPIGLLVILNLLIWTHFLWPKGILPPPTIEFSTSPNTFPPSKSYLPPLEIDEHIYASDPKQRVVFINGHRYFEGDFIQKDMLLESIFPQGIVINYREQKFHLTPP